MVRTEKDPHWAKLASSEVFLWQIHENTTPLRNCLNPTKRAWDAEDKEKAYCEFGFQVYSKPVGEIGIEMENSWHFSFWQKVETLIPETLSWARPLMALILGSKCQARSQGKMGTGWGGKRAEQEALHTWPVWHYHPCRWRPKEGPALLTRASDSSRGPIPIYPLRTLTSLAAECETRWTKQLDGKYILTLFFKWKHKLGDRQQNYF